MPWWPGRRPNVNDKHNNFIRTERVTKPAPQIEEQARELDNHIVERQVAGMLAGQSEAARRHGERRSIEKVVDAQPDMKARRDGRRRPNRVSRATFVKTRKLKVRHLLKRRRKKV